MSRVYWDTMLFVYWLEDHPQFAQRVQEIHSKMEQRKDLLCTSAFALGEILVGPYKLKAADVGQVIREHFKTSAIELLPFDAQTAELYARIRADHNVSPADAIHLATAAQANVHLFLTNDRRLSRLTVPGIHFIAGLDTNLL
jgi:predicted nucleic acid-binding protein